MNFRVPAATPKRLPFRLKRLAVTEEQIEEWSLPTRPTKRSDSRARSFGSSVSVELDAIDPRRLRSLVERAVAHQLARDDPVSQFVERPPDDPIHEELNEQFSRLIGVWSCAQRYSITTFWPST